MKNTIIICLLFFATHISADQMTLIKSGCAGCHQMAVKTVGPSIKEIAQKHKGSDVAQLVKTVKDGRTANELTWGNIPMPPSPALEADVRKVIEWMLTH